MATQQTLEITAQVSIRLEEVDMQAIRAQGAGGQNVNKVSSAIHLRFDISASSLPELIKSRLLQAQDSRISSEGTVVIKAQSHRSQDKNRQDALERLAALIREYCRTPKRRVATRPTLASKRRRMDSKKKQSRLKQQRGRFDHD